METITRKEAKERGLKYYFTGTPCKRGHISKRSIADYACLECKKERPVDKESRRKAARRYYEKNKDYYRQYYRDNKDRINAYSKEHYEANKERKLRLQKEHRNKPEIKKERAEYNRHHYLENKDYYSIQSNQYRLKYLEYYKERAAVYRAAKRLATPPWFEQDKALNIYKEATRISEETGIPHEVDHIVPLKGTKVCGLHWHHNLQILTESENRSKQNKLLDEKNNG